MSNFTLSPNMGLVIPTPGVDPGPDWADNLNNDLTILDTHNHTSGSGVQIPPAGLNINSDLTFNSNNLTTVRSVRFISQVSPISNPEDIGCLYESGIDLYYNDGAGNQIRITQSGAVSGSTGTITGLPSGTASASFGAGTFVFQRATNTSADIDGGSYILRNNSASSFGLTLAPPNSLAANYALTLPLIPASTSFLTIDTSGNFGTASNISAAQIASLSITGSQIANSTITSGKIQSNVNLAGSAVQENGLNVIVSNTNASVSLSLVRATFTGAASLINGEGVSAVRNSAGNYTVTVTTAFADNPIYMTTVNASGSFTSTIVQVAPTVFTVLVFASNTATVTDQTFSVLFIGQRA